MTINTTPDVWTRLVESGLANAVRIAALRAEFEQLPAGENAAATEVANGDAVTEWLARTNRISDYQREVLQAGLSGPFLIDQYLIHAIVDEGPAAGTFRARHVASGYPVRLLFFGGASREDAERWHAARAVAETWRDLDSPALAPVHQCVRDGCWRFIVTDGARGLTLSEKLSRKGRLPFPSACRAVLQLARGLKELARNEVVHGRLSPKFVRVRKSGAFQLLPPLSCGTSEEKSSGGHSGDDDRPENPLKYLSPSLRGRTGNAPTHRDDLFALGQLAVRLISGRTPVFKATDLPGRQNEMEVLKRLWEKYQVPGPVSSLIKELLCADVDDTPPDVNRLVDALQLVAAPDEPGYELDGNEKEWTQYHEFLKQEKRPGTFFGPAAPRVQADVVIDSGRRAAPVNLNSLDATAPVVSVGDRFYRRQSSRRSRATPWVVFSGTVAAAVLAGILISGLVGDSKNDRATTTRSESDAAGADTASRDDGASGPESPANGDGKSVVESPGSGPYSVASSEWFRQRIETDNEKLVWESPTAGPPLDVSRLPAGAEFIVAWHPSRMLDDSEKQLVIRALGPDFDDLLNRWTELTGIDPGRVARMTVSLHPSGNRYELFIDAQLNEPVARPEIAAGLNGMSESPEPAPGTARYSSDVADVCLIDDPGGNDRVERVLVGTGETIDRSFAGGGEGGLDRELARLVERSDAQRDFNVLFLNSALTSEEGMWLFSGAWASMRRPLQLFFDERVRAVLVSAHLDGDTYLEMMSRQTADLSDDDTAVDFRARLDAAAREFTEYIEAEPGHPYWTGIRERAIEMIERLRSGTRVGAERDGVVANCWLPGPALHNLVATVELSLASGGFESASSEAAVASGPQTLGELLETPRSLEITNSPDLRLLLEDLKAEIRNDFPDLPFSFEIRIDGEDLRAEGITQNQRPGDLAIRNQPLADVLTRIMFQATPDKDATGPRDPRCKLVWVVAANPDDPDQPMVLVTTRKAAREKGLELPPAFRPEE